MQEPPSCKGFTSSFGPDRRVTRKQDLKCWGNDGCRFLYTSGILGKRQGGRRRGQDPTAG